MLITLLGFCSLLCASYQLLVFVVQSAIFAEVGDAKEVHDYATLFGYGCDGVCPYVAYEAICKMNAEGLVEAKAKQHFSDEEIISNYRKAAAKGLLKVMSKMGISTLQSYKGAQVRRFDAGFFLSLA